MKKQKSAAGSANPVKKRRDGIFARSGLNTTGALVGKLRCATVALLFPEKVRIGIAETPAGEVMHAVTVECNGTRGLLFAGRDLPLYLRFCIPPLLYVDSGDTPLYVATADVDAGIDTDEWIETHGGELLPAGFNYEHLYTAWRCDTARVSAVSAVSEQIDKRIAGFSRQGYCMSCLPVLQGYANAWKRVLPGGYLIWKVMRERSVIARVEDGRVVATCNSWVSHADVENDNGKLCREISEVAASLSEGITLEKIIVVPQTAAAAVDGRWDDDRIRIAEAPVISDCPAGAEEAFGIASDTVKAGFELLPFELQRKAEKVRRTIAVVAAVLRTLLVVAVVVTVLTGGYIAVSRAVLDADSESIAKIDAEFAEMTAEVKMRDSLFRIVAGKTEYIADESTMTNLLSALQTVFPDGTALKEVSLSERDGSSWRFTLLVFTFSAGDMNTVLGALAKIPGIHDVRTVYSERSDVKKTSSGILFKLEAVWK